MTGKLESMKNKPGKRPPQGAGEGNIQNRSVELKTKNESVVGRNKYHRAETLQRS